MNDLTDRISRAVDGMMERTGIVPVVVAAVAAAALQAAAFLAALP